jgi:FixJ family two-component response regulator
MLTNRVGLSNLSDSLDMSNKHEELLAYFRHVACDLRSAQGSLSLLMKTCIGLSEQELTVLNDTASNIAHIAEDLLARCRTDQYASSKSSPYALVSLAVSEVLNKKRSEYQQVNFDYPEPNIGNSFVFTKIDPEDLNFLVSSIIDRSVKASDIKGKIDLLVGSNSDRVWLMVTDYGKKIPPEKVGNIYSAFDDEYFSRLHEILKNSGKVFIDSSATRTRVILEFPVVDCPDWMAEYITLHDGDTVVVLSDDASIHSEWDLCFQKENVSLEHFTSGEKAIAFINAFSKKNRLFFLADFDLVNKELNGLQILWQTLLQRQTIFMISSYSDQGILEFAHKVGVQILPKQLIPKIPYRIIKTERAVIMPTKTDVVIIDDIKSFADSLASYVKNKYPVVQTYYNPYDFLTDLPRYTKDVKIIMDNGLGANITGLEISKQLHEAGYSNIYLLTGSAFVPGEIPDYITLVTKGDMIALDKAI